MRSTGSSKTYDILLLADCARKGDAGLRVAQEIRVCADLGCKIGIFDLQAGSDPASVSPDIRSCAREGLVDVLPVQTRAHAKLAIAFSPSTLKAAVQDLSGFGADRVILVHERSPVLSQMGLWLALQIGPVAWAPTNRWVRAKLAALNMPVPLLEEDWRPVGRPLHTIGDRSSSARPTVYGRVSDPGPTQWPKSREEIQAVYPIGQGRDFRVIGVPPKKLWQTLSGLSDVSVFEPGDVSVERFLEMLDVFLYFPGIKVPAMPEVAIASSMASGKIVVLPRHLECHFGPGAVYADASEALPLVEDLLSDEVALLDVRNKARHYSKFQFSEDSHRAKILDLLEQSKPRRRRRARNNGPNRVIFVPSNGVGLGHVTRLLAIARRLDDRAEPVFATLAQAANIIESFGYLAEYIPSRGDTATDREDWDAWFRHELGDLINRYEASAVVFDGNNPTLGLVQAALSRGRCPLVWVRRGMMGPAPSTYLRNSRFMDLVIEPGEIAGEWDQGPTAEWKREALQVDPITLLDQDELLPRKAAMRALGLSPDRPAVLVQLGAGANRDLMGLTGEVIEQMEKFPDIQLVVAEWENSQIDFSDLPVTRVVRGFPLSRFFKAFDFSVSAAGYNTFHEVIASGLPTIFVANRHPSMDRQDVRAEYVQAHGAGFDLREDQLYQLPALCEALLNEQALVFMRRSCRQLHAGNGAAAAADAIMSLVDTK